jgi:branched-chain amino acid transport system ATP-binding protein
MNKTILRVENLSKSFGSRLIALDRVSFSQIQGTIKAIIGPNGAGKTTLVNLIMGYFPYKEWKGRVYFEEKDVSSLKKYERANRGVTKTYQLVKLFKNMSVIENVMVGVHLRTKGNMIANIARSRKTVTEEIFIYEEAIRCLDLVNLVGRAEDEIDSLSYGTQKLVEIARAIASKPNLLIMDEPAAGLNSFEVEQLGKLIMRIRGSGITVLIVEHNMDLVMNLSDEVLVMDFGQKIAEGKPADIQRNEEVIRAYLGEKIDFAES